MTTVVGAASTSTGLSTGSMTTSSSSTSGRVSPTASRETFSRPTPSQSSLDASLTTTRWPLSTMEGENLDASGPTDVADVKRTSVPSGSVASDDASTEVCEPCSRERTGSGRTGMRAPLLRNSGTSACAGTPSTYTLSRTSNGPGSSADGSKLHVASPASLMLPSERMLAPSTSHSTTTVRPSEEMFAPFHTPTSAVNST